MIHIVLKYLAGCWESKRHAFPCRFYKSLCIHLVYMYAQTIFSQQYMPAKWECVFQSCWCRNKVTEKCSLCRTSKLFDLSQWEFPLAQLIKNSGLAELAAFCCVAPSFALGNKRLRLQEFFFWKLPLLSAAAELNVRHVACLILTDKPLKRHPSTAVLWKRRDSTFFIRICGFQQGLSRSHTRCLMMRNLIIRGFRQTQRPKSLSNPVGRERSLNNSSMNFFS